MKKLLALLLMMTLLCPAALADEQLCMLDLAALPDSLSTTSSYISAVCALSESTQISIAIYDAWGSLTYQRNYGMCSGQFRSEDIYLRLNGGATSYRLQAMLGNEVRETMITRSLPRLENNIACTSGYPLTKVNGRDTRLSVTLLDVNALSAAPVTVPVQASSLYELGTVTFSLQDGFLYADAALDPNLNAVISDSAVFVASTSVSAANLDSSRFHGIQGMLNSMIDLQGAECVAVLVRLSVSFDPASALPDMETELPGQEDLWLRLMQQTESEAVG